MTPTELEALVAKTNVAELLEAMRGLSEQERRALAPTALRLEQHCSSQRDSQIIVDIATPGADNRMARDQFLAERWAPAAAALLATGSISELAQRANVFASHYRLPWWDEHIVEALRERPRSLLDGLVKALLARGIRRWPDPWPICYRLVSQGLAQRPISEEWDLGFLGTYSSDNRPSRPVQEYLDDPIFAEQDLWRLFEIEGDANYNFANADAFLGHHDPNGTWAATLVARAASGTISKARLLDATLDALQRDFVPYRARWFSNLHRDLRPSSDERVARLDRYLALLTSRVPVTVTFALDALVALEEAGGLPAELVLMHLAPAIQARTKKTALAALAFAERITTPEGTRATATLAAEALSHEVLAVQERAIAMLTRFGDRRDHALAELVRDHAHATAATLRRQLFDWLGEPAPSISPEHESLAASPKEELDALALRRARSPDEAIEILSGAIERFDDPDELEAALDGVARFCGEQPPDFAGRIAPLAKRAARLSTSFPRNTFSGWNLRRDMGRIALAWSDTAPVDDHDPRRCVRTFLGGRIREVALRAALRKPTTLLSTPTHRDGWIDPVVLAQRALTVTPDPLDAVQSLLRIARDNRIDSVVLAADVPGEYGAALRFALGGRPPAKAPEGDLWLAAEIARGATEYPPRLTVLRHDPADYADDTLRRHNETLLMRWAATVTPSDLRWYFHAGSAAIASNLELSSALWWNAACLEPLLRAGIEIDATVSRLLAVAMASKLAAEGGLASDALIQMVVDGRANAETLGDAFAELLNAALCKRRHWETYVPEPDEPTWIKDLVNGNVERTGSGIWAATLKGEISAPINCKRWATRLQDVARVSARHVSFVRDLIERALRGLPAQAPHGLGSLLVLLRELCAETGRPIRDPEARATLTSIAGHGATAQIARALLVEGS